MNSMTTTIKLLAICVAATLAFSAPSAAKSKSEKKREKIIEMRQEVLTQLYAEEESAKDAVEDAYGYAVFSNVGVNVIFLSAGGGKGVAHNNQTGKNTYMKMASAGVGIGLGVKDFRAVFIFHTKDAFRQFVDKGWDLSGQADAAAKADEKGAEASGAIKIADGVTLYQITKNGLALQATIQGTKYWQDKKLNK